MTESDSAVRCWPAGSSPRPVQPYSGTPRPTRTAQCSPQVPAPGQLAIEGQAHMPGLSVHALDNRPNTGVHNPHGGTIRGNIGVRQHPDGVPTLDTLLGLSTKD